MFGFGKKIETVTLDESLATKGEDALRTSVAMLQSQNLGGTSREEMQQVVRTRVMQDMTQVETLIVGLPDVIWKVVNQALEKGPQTLEAPSELDAEQKTEFFNELAEMYDGMFFVHVFPDREEGGAPRITVVEEVRKAWKDHRRENLQRREAWDRLCTLAQGAVNLYGCLDVDRFVAMVGEVCTAEMTTAAVQQMLELRTQFEDGTMGFSCRQGELLHRALAEDSSAHARVRRAHVGKEPLEVSLKDLQAEADENAIQRTDVFKTALKAFSKSVPKALAGEADDIVAGFAMECRKGDDVAMTMGQLAAIASMSGGEDCHLDCAGLTPLYNGVPLWEEYGRTREQAGKARDFSIAGGSSSGTQVNTGVQIGRNDPCPCGSGKKFKKCCGRGL